MYTQKLILNEPLKPKLSEFNVNSYSKRVYKSKSIEDKTGELLCLKKHVSYTHYSPDILDFDNNTIGEIKTFTGKNRLFLSFDQFLKYIYLKDILKTCRNLNGELFNFELYYFFVRYKILEILDIYKLNETNVSHLFNTNEIKSTKWYYGERFIEFKLSEISEYKIK